VAGQKTWIDSHCHLDSFEERATTIARDALKLGVGAIVTVGTDVASSIAAAELASRLDHVWAGVGIHPHEASSFDSSALATLREMAEQDKIVAIGETGLDYYRDLSPREAQWKSFAEHIELAKELDLALVVHVRNAYEDVFELLRRSGAPDRLVFHCFSGTAEDVEVATELGGYISFAGNVSFKNAQPLRDTAKACPLEKLLVETDSPFLAPEPRRGKENQPSFLPYVGDALARAIGRNVEEVCEATTQNAKRVFRLRRLN
jgi:TatD DNase family protein